MGFAFASYSSLKFFLSLVTAKHNGSISAEHGLGFKKANAIHYTKTQSAIDLMHKLKQMMDPKVITSFLLFMQ